MKVRDIMTWKLECIPQDSAIRDAAKKMRDLDIGMLPVEQNGEIVGAITDRDITIRSIAAGDDPNTTQVAKAMSTKVLACIDEDDIQHAAEIMEEHQIRRLMVQDLSGEFIGIVTLADLARNHKAEFEVEVLEQVSRPSQQSSATY